jgi:hypothetical protein
MSIEYPLGTGKRIKVKGRNDEAVIVDAGKNIGSIYCVGVHFESTGEVVYTRRGAVTPA